MKKSFKKAGAAVLSMAMLLSMGAISMPVYAADTAKPATVTVQIVTATDAPYAYQGEGQKYEPNGNGDGTDWEAKASSNAPGGSSYNFKYDYLDLNGVTGAKVTMYRVAKLTGTNGWDWEDYVNDYVTESGKTIPGFESFAKLLANKDGTEDTDKQSQITQDWEFNTNSSDLQAMAAYLERVVEDLKFKASQETGNNTTPKSDLLKSISTATVDVTSENIKNGVTLPTIDANTLDLNGDGVLSDEEKAITQNVIGYYLIVTETDQSGVLVQPVLVSLKNGDAKKITLKGSTIDINKKIKTVKPEVENSKDLDATFDEDAKSALVSQKDKVYYEISAQLPKYDVNVSSEDITDFVITDTMSEGLTLDADITDHLVDGENFEVFLVEKASDSETAAKRWTLQGSDLKNYADYQLEKADYGHGFTLTITGYQMRELDVYNNTPNQLTGQYAMGSDDDIDTVAMLSPSAGGHEATETLEKATRLNDTKNVGNLDKMENAYIYVRFYADVNKGANGTDASPESDIAFDRTFTKYIEVKDIKATDVAAVGENFKDIENQVARAKIFGETLYNKRYSSSDYAVNCFAEEDRAAIIAALTAAGCDGSTALSVSSTEPANELSDYDANNLNENTPEGEFLRILARLALDKHNITLNGESNTAKMTYGNRYSTGGGDGEKKTDYSKVYSVDLQLDKFVETLWIDGAPTIPATYTGYGTYYDAHKDDTVTLTHDGTTIEVKLKDFAASYGDGTDEYKVLSGLALEAPALTAGDDDTAEHTGYFSGGSALNANVQKVLKYLIDAENTANEANDNYNNSYKTDPVVGAIFHLVRNYDDNGTAKTIDLGYAISTKDGSLQKLESVAELATGTTPTARDGYESYTFTEGTGEDKKTYVGYIPVTKDATGDITSFNGDRTWRMLEVGDYTITEVSVPTGFKKWANGVNFTITADQEDSVGPEYLAANAFLGSYGAKSTITASPNANKSIGIASIQEQKDVAAAIAADPDAPSEVSFAYANSTTEAKSGVLSHALYNEYLDELPATGGMGTVLFTAGGIAVILMAGALFVVYMKKRNAEEEE